MVRPKKDEEAATTAVVEVLRGEMVRTGDLPDLGTIAKEVLTGDLQHLTNEQQAQYLHAVCKSLGLNPLTNPFAIVEFKKKKTLYARRECAEQLRRIYQVSVQITDQRQVGDLYIVSARATLPGGRTDENVGAVTIKGYTGEDLANQIMKAVTKATRRVTLGICGLGCLDESEIPEASASVQVVSQPPQQAPQKEKVSVESFVLCTGVQVDMIDTLCRDLEWSPADLQAAITKRYDCSDPRQLTQEQAEAVISGLQKAVAKKLGDEPQPDQPAGAARMATAAQVAKIEGLTKDLGWNLDRLSSSLVQKFGVREAHALTAEQAAQVIAGLTKAKAGGAR